MKNVFFKCFHFLKQLYKQWNYLFLAWILKEKIKIPCFKVDMSWRRNGWHLWNHISLDFYLWRQGEPGQSWECCLRKGKLTDQANWLPQFWKIWREGWQRVSRFEGDKYDRIRETVWGTKWIDSIVKEEYTKGIENKSLKEKQWWWGRLSIFGFKCVLIPRGMVVLWSLLGLGTRFAQPFGE